MLIDGYEWTTHETSSEDIDPHAALDAVYGDDWVRVLRGKMKGGREDDRT
jgi:hypothetical protein